MIKYLAGFFDGEGCITLGSNGGLTVSVVNTSLPVLLIFEECFRGVVEERKDFVNKKQYQWRIYGSDAKNFLEDIRHRLIDKRDQAATALEYLEHKEKYGPVRYEGKKGAHAHPDRAAFIKKYQTILTEQKLGKHIDQ